jgi:MFS family permease
MVSGLIATLRGNFSPLRDANFRTYLGGQAISLIGTWLQVAAMGWVVWKLTGEATALGTVNALGALPLLLLSPWTGVWADRLDRRKLLIFTQAGAMLLAFILAYLTQTELVQLWHVYALSLALGVITALDFPVQQAFLGDLTGMASIRKAINLNITILQVSRILGPAFAGLIIGQLGASLAFWLNGLSFLAVIISLMLVRARQVRSAAAGGKSGSFGEALRFMAGQPRMIDMILFMILTTFFGLSIILNILPAVADRVLGGDATTLGLLMAASGAGALLGVTFVAPVVQSLKRTGVALSSLLMWMGFWFVIFGATNNLAVAVFALFMCSIAPPAIMTTTNGMSQLMSPPAMRGRIISIAVTVSFGMQPVAAYMIGRLADVLGIGTAIDMYAISLMIGGALMLARPALRTWEFNARPEEPIVPAAAEAS